MLLFSLILFIGHIFWLGDSIIRMDFIQKDNHQKAIRPMYKINLSSNSESSDQNIENYFKKVYCQGDISDSEHQDSQMDQSLSEEIKKLQKKEQKNHVYDQSKPRKRSKNIKKNCQSAKMSRQRKKVYLQLLQQKAKELKIQILNRQNNVKDLKDEILQKLRTSNQQKYKFISQKLALSKKMMQIKEKLQNSRKNYQEIQVQIEYSIKNEPQNLVLQKNMSPNTLVSLKIEQAKNKPKKKKISDQKDMKQMQLIQQISQQENYLQLTIDSYMVLYIIDSIILEQEEAFLLTYLKGQNMNCFKGYKDLYPNINHRTFVGISREAMNRMINLLQKLDERAKKLDYYLRGLKQRIKYKYIVQFLLNRQFFINKSADTIFKNSLIASQETPQLA